jgi:hypothetical protein
VPVRRKKMRDATKETHATPKMEWTSPLWSKWGYFFVNGNKITSKSIINAIIPANTATFILNPQISLNFPKSKKAMRI